MKTTTRILTAGTLAAIALPLTAAFQSFASPASRASQPAAPVAVPAHLRPPALKKSRQTCQAHPFVVNSMNSVFALQMYIKGTFRYSGDKIEIHAADLRIFYQPKVANSGPKNITSMRVGLGYMNENHRWNVDHDTTAELIRTMDPGDVLLFKDIDFVVDRSDLENLDGRWLVFTLVTPLEDGREGTSYAHSDTRIFKN